MKQVHHTPAIFLLSGFTYPDTAINDKLSEEAGYQLAELTQSFLVHVHMKGPVLAVSDQSQLSSSVFAGAWPIFQRRMEVWDEGRLKRLNTQSKD